MGTEQRANRQLPKVEPAEELMDKLGLPREVKYDFEEALLNALPLDAVEEIMEMETAHLNRPIKRPEVNWDTVQDTVSVGFKSGAELFKRVLLDNRRFVDYDKEDNLTVVVLRDVSQGVSLQGLPEADRIRRMLRRREIRIVAP